MCSLQSVLPPFAFNHVFRSNSCLYCTCIVFIGKSCRTTSTSGFNIYLKLLHVFGKSLQFGPGLEKKRSKERTHSHHARLKIARHFPADALLNVLPTHMLVLLKDYSKTRYTSMTVTM